jgi:uroporphyrinogen III methyltransferase/synthase
MQPMHGREAIRRFDAGSLVGKRVLVTRPAAEVAELASLLREAGAEPILAPTIAIVPPDDAAAAERAVRDATLYDWIVFTSRNGVAAFLDRMPLAGADARELAGVKVAAIGARTAEWLVHGGLRADFVPARYVGEDLAAGLLERTQPAERVLIFGAQEARDIVPGALRAAGRDVTVVAAYKTVVVLDRAIAAAAEATEIWTLSSASAVHGLVANVADAAARAAHKTIACIGPVTAQAARECGFPVYAVAGEFTIAGLVEALSAAMLRT